MAVVKMSKQDLKWQAEDDARVLAQAEAIKADKARMRRAAVAAKSMADEAMDKAKAMKRISKGAPSGRNRRPKR